LHSGVSEEMKTLGKIEKKNGFSYYLVKREGNKCIYAQKVGGIVFAYEVFYVKTLKERIIKFKLSDKKHKEVLLEEREVLPSNEDFGKIAWTFEFLHDAKKCFEGL
jgi:hypothetical protein